MRTWKWDWVSKILNTAQGFCVAFFLWGVTEPIINTLNAAKWRVFPSVCRSLAFMGLFFIIIALYDWYDKNFLNKKKECCCCGHK